MSIIEITIILISYDNITKHFPINLVFSIYRKLLCDWILNQNNCEYVKIHSGQNYTMYQFNIYFIQVEMRIIWLKPDIEIFRFRVFEKHSRGCVKTVDLKCDLPSDMNEFSEFHWWHDVNIIINFPFVRL